LALVTTLAAASCATRVAAPPTVTTPRYPDFVYPSVPPQWRASEAEGQQALGWQWLQAGGPRTAERVFGSLIDRTPTFYPAEAGLGYVALATQDYAGALARFDAALSLERGYVSALVGRGEALLGLAREEEALGSFQAALAVDASLDLPRRRVDVLQFRLLQANLARARRAAEAGRHDEAMRAYRQAIAASPESGFLYRELGVVERRGGELALALEHLQRAVELDSRDAAAWREIGEVLEARQDLNAAAAAYTQSLSLEADPALEARLERLRTSLVLSRLPTEYRAVPESPALTRGELAALIGVRFETLLAGASARSSEVVLDTTGHWAAPWIFTVIRTGIMDAYPNHTFQPRGIVRRGGLAQSVSQLLGVMAERRPALAEPWRAARRAIADVPSDHLSYSAVSLAVASGAMPLLEGDTFQLVRPVSGAEAVEVLDRLEALLR
jgi:tetratricopeptide (TPR) repeat protein